MAAVFGTAPLFAQVPVSSSAAAWLQQDTREPVTPRAKQGARKRRLAFMDKDEGLAPEREDRRSRKAALGKWQEIARGVGSHSALVVKAGSDLKGQLEDVFAAKSDATLRARAGSILAYVRWCRLQRKDPWPIQEEKSYHYVSYLKFSRAPATKASTFLRSISFIGHFLEMTAAAETRKSSRIQGSTWRQFTRKKETEGRSPLSVPQVRMLQATICTPGDAVERLLAGLAMTLVATRVRFIDAQRARAEPTLDTDTDDWGFLELPIGRTKTTTAARPQDVKRSKVAVGHALGFGRAPWARKWLELRASLNFDAKKDGCLMRAMDAKGIMLKRRLRSHEFTRWLQAFFMKKSLHIPSQLLGSHCGKVTALSWCAKFAVDSDTRRALGYHIPRGDKMVQVYSRDYQAGPLRRLAQVEHAIDEKVFDPDATRSGRFIKPQADTDYAKFAANPEVTEYKFILAIAYKKLHARLEASDRSPCGRAAADQPGFSTHFTIPAEATTACKKCFKGKTLDEIGADI